MPEQTGPRSGRRDRGCWEHLPGIAVSVKGEYRPHMGIWGLLLLFGAPAGLAVLAYFFGRETRPGLNETDPRDTAGNNVPTAREHV